MTGRWPSPLAAAPAPGPAEEAPPRDAGFTLVELMTAMAIFGILMVIVGGAMLSGFSGIRGAMTRADAQSGAQTAAEYAAKLLRYMDTPEGQASPIVEASPTSITFFTYAGTGTKHDVPYKARLYTATNASGTKSLLAQVWTPTQIAGGWTWNGTPTTRTLLTLPSTATIPLNLAVWVRNPLTVPAADARNATPATSGPVVLTTGEVPESVLIQVGNRNEISSVVSQQVRLENLT